MKTAHIKTVDGTTIMTRMTDQVFCDSFESFLNGYPSDSPDISFRWEENGEKCYLYRKYIISVRIREV